MRKIALAVISLSVGLAVAGCSQETQENTQKAADSAGEDVGSAAAKASDGVNHAADKASVAVNKAADAASDAAHEVGDKVKEGFDKTKAEIHEKTAPKDD
jgi:hypothetical protein